MISRQLSGLETILREMCFWRIRPGFLLVRFHDPGGSSGFFMPLSRCSEQASVPLPRITLSR